MLAFLFLFFLHTLELTAYFELPYLLSIIFIRYINHVPITEVVRPVNPQGEVNNLQN
jgi:hypothetical protein